MGNINSSVIRSWVENNIKVSLGTDIEQYLEHYNMQTIQIVFDSSDIKWRNVNVTNTCKSKILMALAEQYLANIGLDTEALAKVDNVQDAKNFGVNGQSSYIDKTAINTLGYDRYLRINKESDSIIIKIFFLHSTRKIKSVCKM